MAIVHIFYHGVATAGSGVAGLAILSVIAAGGVDHAINYDPIEVDNSARAELVTYFTTDKQYGAHHRSFPRINNRDISTPGLENMAKACSIRSGFYTSNYQWAYHRGPMERQVYGAPRPNLEDQPEFMSCIRTISYVDVKEAVRLQGPY